MIFVKVLFAGFVLVFLGYQVYSLVRDLKKKKKGSSEDNNKKEDEK